jgi:hypothetical protein
MYPQARWFRQNWVFLCVVTVLGAVSSIIDYALGTQGGIGPALIVSALLIGVMAFLNVRTGIDIPF